MKESAIEAYLRERVKTMGGLAYKFVSPGNAGVPDRMVCLPGGRLAFVELKAPGEKPGPKQLMQHRRLRSLGQAVYVIDSKAGVDGLLEEMGR